MAVVIKMPQLSQTTEDVKLVSWLVSEGQQIKKGDHLCEVETDKAVMPVESFESGTVLKLAAQPDTMVMAGDVIAVLGKPGENIDDVIGDPGEDKSKAAGLARALPSGGAPGKMTEVKATPLVRNIAKKKNISLEDIAGRGPGGLITKKDLEEYSAGRKTGAPAPARRPAAEAGGFAQERAVESAPRTAADGYREYPLSKNQTHVAMNLTRSFTQVPHYYLKCRVYTDPLLAWREKNRQPDGAKVSVYSLLVYAAAKALRKHPGLNGFFRDNKLVLFNGINVGIAVTARDDLHVPVIKDADKKGIREIDKEVKWLVAKTQNGKLEPKDILDGSFTLTNLGTYPVDEFCAIINPPQAGIIAVGHITKTLYIDDNDAMSIRNACTVTGSFDHRIVNGSGGAAFLAYFKKIIEEEITE